MATIYCKVLNYFGKANDWIPVWKEIGYVSKGTKNIPSTYIIKYSKSLKEYKLFTEGYNPESHPIHRIASMHLINLRKSKDSNSQLNIKPPENGD